MKRAISITLDGEILDWIEKKEGKRSAVIENILRAAFAENILRPDTPEIIESRAMCGTMHTCGNIQWSEGERGEEYVWSCDRCGLENISIRNKGARVIQ